MMPCRRAHLRGHAPHGRQTALRAANRRQGLQRAGALLAVAAHVLGDGAALDGAAVGAGGRVGPDGALVLRVDAGGRLDGGQLVRLLGALLEERKKAREI